MGRKIILCFDGTGKSEKDKSQHLTNISKIAIRSGWNHDNTEDSLFPEQKVLYYPGPGTRGSFFLRLFNKLFSPELTIGHIINLAKKDLVKIQPQSDDEIAIIGFSRGSAIARRFSVLLCRGEIVSQVKSIKFLGCFDTVAQIGLPSFKKWPDDHVLFENNRIAECVEQAVHYVSLDERRFLFPVTLMDYEPHVSEIWFRGAHSDIGGGFKEHGLSDITLEKMIVAMKNTGFEVRTPQEIQKNLIANVSSDDMQSHPDDLAKIHFDDSVESFARRIPAVLENGLVSNKKPSFHKSVLQRMQELYKFVD